jgi:hypothetical protein
MHQRTCSDCFAIVVHAIMAKFRVSHQKNKQIQIKHTNLISPTNPSVLTLIATENPFAPCAMLPN